MNQLNIKCSCGKAAGVAELAEGQVRVRWRLRFNTAAAGRALVDALWPDAGYDPDEWTILERQEWTEAPRDTVLAEDAEVVITCRRGHRLTVNSPTMRRLMAERRRVLVVTPSDGPARWLGMGG